MRYNKNKIEILGNYGSPKSTVKDQEGSIENTSAVIQNSICSKKHETHTGRGKNTKVYNKYKINGLEAAKVL